MSSSKKKGKKKWIVLAIIGAGAYLAMSYYETKQAATSGATPISSGMTPDQNNTLAIFAVVVGLVWFLCLAAAIAGGVALFKWLRKRGELPDVSESTAYGSADFADEDTLAAYLMSDDDQERRLIVGLVEDNVTGNCEWVGLTWEQQESHILIIGPTGQGKSANIIIPGLLREEGNRAVFAIDPKSELYRLTAGATARNLHVWRFAPTDAGHSNTYNPLAYVSTMEDAQDLARAWIENTGQSSKNSFFDRNTEAMITAVVLHLRDTEPAAPFSRLAHLLNQPWQKVQTIIEHSPSSPARAIAGPLLANIGKNQNLISGLMTDLANRFFILHDAEIQAATASNEIDFNAMIEAPRAAALYLCIPASQAARLKPLSALFLMQMFRAWIRKAEQTGQLARPAVCYLDEFANAGRVPHFEEYITYLRSLHIALIPAIRDFSQLDALYGRDITPTILSNSTTHLVLPGCGQFVTEYYSKRLGDTTIEVINEGRVYNSWTPTHTRNQQQVKRRLMTPEEIRTMPRGQILMVVGNQPPLLMAGSPYYEDEEENQLAHLPAPAISRRNPVQPAAAPAPLVRVLPTTGPTNAQAYPAYPAAAQSASYNYPYSAPAAMQPAPQYAVPQYQPQTGPTLSQNIPPPPPMSNTGSILGSLPQAYPTGNPYQTQASDPYSQLAPQLDPYSHLQPPPAANPYQPSQSQQRPPTQQPPSQPQQRPPTMQPPPAAYTFPYPQPQQDPYSQPQRPPAMQPHQAQPSSGPHSQPQRPATAQPPAQEEPQRPTTGQPSQFMPRPSTNKHPTTQRPATGPSTNTDKSGPFSLLP